jgi:hypothetical protein
VVGIGRWGEGAVADGWPAGAADARSTEENDGQPHFQQVPSSVRWS